MKRAREVAKRSKSEDKDKEREREREREKRKEKERRKEKKKKEKDNRKKKDKESRKKKRDSSDSDSDSGSDSRDYAKNPRQVPPDTREFDDAEAQRRDLAAIDQAIATATAAADGLSLQVDKARRKIETLKDQVSSASATVADITLQITTAQQELAIIEKVKAENDAPSDAAEQRRVLVDQIKTANELKEQSVRLRDAIETEAAKLKDLSDVLTKEREERQQELLDLRKRRKRLLDMPQRGRTVAPTNPPADAAGPTVTPAKPAAPAAPADPAAPAAPPKQRQKILLDFTGDDDDTRPRPMSIEDLAYQSTAPRFTDDTALVAPNFAIAADTGFENARQLRETRDNESSRERGGVVSVVEPVEPYEKRVLREVTYLRLLRRPYWQERANIAMDVAMQNQLKRFVPSTYQVAILCTLISGGRVNRLEICKRLALSLNGFLAWAWSLKDIFFTAAATGDAEMILFVVNVTCIIFDKPVIMGSRPLQPACLIDALAQGFAPVTMTVDDFRSFFDAMQTKLVTLFTKDPFSLETGDVEVLLRQAFMVSRLAGKWALVNSTPSWTKFETQIEMYRQMSQGNEKRKWTMLRDRVRERFAHPQRPCDDVLMDWAHDYTKEIFALLLRDQRINVGQRRKMLALFMRTLVDYDDSFSVKLKEILEPLKHFFADTLIPQYDYPGAPFDHIQSLLTHCKLTFDKPLKTATPLELIPPSLIWSHEAVRVLFYLYYHIDIGDASPLNEHAAKLIENARPYVLMYALHDWTGSAGLSAQFDALLTIKLQKPEYKNTERRTFFPDAFRANHEHRHSILSLDDYLAVIRFGAKTKRPNLTVALPLSLLTRSSLISDVRYYALTATPTRLLSDAQFVDSLAEGRHHRLYVEPSFSGGDRNSEWDLMSPLLFTTGLNETWEMRYALVARFLASDSFEMSREMIYGMVFDERFDTLTSLLPLYAQHVYDIVLYEHSESRFIDVDAVPANNGMLATFLVLIQHADHVPIIVLNQLLEMFVMTRDERFAILFYDAKARYDKTASFEQSIKTEFDAEIAAFSLEKDRKLQEAEQELNDVSDDELEDDIVPQRQKRAIFSWFPFSSFVRASEPEDLRFDLERQKWNTRINDFEDISDDDEGEDASWNHFYSRAAKKRRNEYRRDQRKKIAQKKEAIVQQFTDGLDEKKRNLAWQIRARRKSRADAERKALADSDEKYIQNMINDVAEVTPLLFDLIKDEAKSLDISMFKNSIIDVGLTRQSFLISQSTPNDYYDDSGWADTYREIQDSLSEMYRTDIQFIRYLQTRAEADYDQKQREHDQRELAARRMGAPVGPQMHIKTEPGRGRRRRKGAAKRRGAAQTIIEIADEDEHDDDDDQDQDQGLDAIPAEYDEVDIGLGTHAEVAEDNTPPGPANDQ